MPGGLNTWQDSFPQNAHSEQESEEDVSARPHKYIKCQKSKLGPQPGSKIPEGRRPKDGVQRGLSGAGHIK